MSPLPSQDSRWDLPCLLYMSLFCSFWPRALLIKTPPSFLSLPVQIAALTTLALNFARQGPQFLIAGIILSTSLSIVVFLALLLGSVFPAHQIYQVSHTIMSETQELCMSLCCQMNTDLRRVFWAFPRVSVSQFWRVINFSPNVTVFCSLNSCLSPTLLKDYD